MVEVKLLLEKDLKRTWIVRVLMSRADKETIQQRRTDFDDAVHRFEVSDPPLRLSVATFYDCDPP